VLHHLALGQLKGQQHPAADFERVFNGLESRSERGPTLDGQK